MEDITWANETLQNDFLVRVFLSSIIFRFMLTMLQLCYLYLYTPTMIAGVNLISKHKVCMDQLIKSLHFLSRIFLKHPFPTMPKWLSAVLPNFQSRVCVDQEHLQQCIHCPLPVFPHKYFEGAAPIASKYIFHYRKILKAICLERCDSCIISPRTVYIFSYFIASAIARASHDLLFFRLEIGEDSF